MALTTTFAHVDDENNVYSIEQGDKRHVGQYPNVTAEEALAYFERKFVDLEAQVRNLEQRVKAKSDAISLKKAQEKLHNDLLAPNAVGDLASLRTRVSVLTDAIAALVSEKNESSKEATEKALAEKEAIVAAAEKLANQDPQKTIWKSGSAELTKLFEQWQELQKNGPRIPKNLADPLWKRFSTARTKFESGKRAYFATLDASVKQAKSKRSELVAQAEALISKGADAAADYRKLLDAWKNTGRVKGDDALWAKFKAAGDAIYAAKGEAIAAENAEQNANLQAKRALLAEFKPLDPAVDLSKAKEQYSALAAKWEKIGRVPRENVREVEDKIRAVENAIKAAEQEAWRKSDPAAQDRANSVIGQLEAGIAKLEEQLKLAQAAKDTKLISELSAAIETKTTWLKVVTETK